MKWLSGGIVVALVLVLFGVLVPRPLFERSMAGDLEPAREILLLANPIHTDIALRLTQDVRDAFQGVAVAGLAIDHPDAAFIVLGWGGRSFYIETPTWGDLKPMPVLRALTVDRSVLRVEVAGEIDTGHPAVRRLSITEPGHQALVQAVLSSFERENGQLLPIAGAAYGPSDAFFEARGRFNALLGCNTWTGAMLRAAGHRTGAWTPLPQLLDLSLDLHS